MPDTPDGNRISTDPYDGPSQPQAIVLWRTRAHNIFCTFPRWRDTPATLEELQGFATKARRIVSDCKFAVFSCETHDGDTGYHLHAVLNRSTTGSITSRILNRIVYGEDPERSGHFEAVRGIVRSIRYTIKDNLYYAVGIDIPEFLRRHPGSSSQQPTVGASVMEMIKEGKTLWEIAQTHQTFGIRHSNQIRKMQQMWITEERKKQRLEWSILIYSSNISEVNEVGQWLNGNIMKEREFKKKQLWVHGPPGVGKTSMIRYLKKFLSVYDFPMDEEFYDGYSDEHDLVVLDEFVGQKQIAFLNKFLEGDEMALRIKGAQIVKQKNMPVIILSNFSPKDCYRKVTEERLAPLLARLQVVEWNDLVCFHSGTIIKL